MAKAHAEASAAIPAAPEIVYAVLSDYRNHHPNILPKENFSEFVLEEGGQGAGTVFRAVTRVGGGERRIHMRVAEPQKGRVLTETDLSSAMVTTFAVVPEAGGVRVTIVTDWDTAPGLTGWIERIVAPGLLVKVYRQELANLAEYVKREQAA